LQKNASIQTSLLDLFSVPKTEVFETWLQRRRPRSPSLNHNVKQRRLDDFHVELQTEHHLATSAAKQRGRGL
jgi:hypothetical protein